MSELDTHEQQVLISLERIYNDNDLGMLIPKKYRVNKNERISYLYQTLIYITSN